MYLLQDTKISTEVAKCLECDVIGVYILKPSCGGEKVLIAAYIHQWYNESEDDDA